MQLDLLPMSGVDSFSICIALPPTSDFCLPGFASLATAGEVSIYGGAEIVYVTQEACWEKP